MLFVKFRKAERIYLRIVLNLRFNGYDLKNSEEKM